jgi:flagellar assembly protein FliH
MGKIVKGAKLVKEAYVVVVPEIERDPEPLDAPDLDVFGVPRDDLAFGDELLSGEPLEAEYVAPEIDFDQVRAEARALIDKAAADGEAILCDAAARAKELVERAHARAAQVQEQARQNGHEDGLESGRAEGRAELEEDVATIHELIESVRAQRNSVIETAEPELVRLAMAIAERVVYDHVAIDENVVLENVRHGLARLIGREIVTLRVNPADAEVLRQYREATAANNDVEHLRIIEDQRVDRGGVVIETEAGTIDAKVSTQLREARRALTNGDSVAMPPAQAS